MSPLRFTAGMSHKELARQADMSKAAISRFESVTC